MATSSKVVSKAHLIPFTLLVCIFFVWGLAANMTDMLLAAFKKIMSMGDFQTSLIQVAYYGSYFFLAFPAALFIRKFSYKAGILLGLGMYIVGALLFYPASQTMQYEHFLVALFVIAGGITFLETSANPYALVMGDESTAIQRLNLAQAFNPIGALTGVVAGKFIILSALNEASESERIKLSTIDLQNIQEKELFAVMIPYVGIAVLLFVIWIIIVSRKMPKGAEASKTPIMESIKRLAKNKMYRSGVLIQFLNVGGMTAVFSFMIRFVMAEMNLDEEGAATYQIISLITFTVSRFAFTALLSKYSPQFLLGISSFVGVICLAIAISTGGIISVVSLIAISACMSLTFPTIFGLACHGTGKDQKIAGSGLVMAVCGGAALPALQGYISDVTGSIKVSYLVPLVCLISVVLYSLYANSLLRKSEVELMEL